ncbi:MAG: hypothetical protein AABY05_00170 [Nanoarchaeota archaeon]
MRNKLGQVALFVIIAIVLVFAILAFVFFRKGFSTDQIPEELQPVFDYYSQCLLKEARTGTDILGIQGGVINSGDYLPGSDYAPFSSHLNFLGSPVKYWYYVSGNGLIKEQVPTKSQMAKELGDYITEGLQDCDFRSFISKGYTMDIKEGDLKINIEDERVLVASIAELTVRKGDLVGRKSQHEIEVDSKLGKFYDLALDIYNKEKDEFFLEQYAVDTLYNYAPVDGVEIQCGPKIWSSRKVESDLKDALQNNLASLKLRGDYYKISDKKREYFVIDKETDESVNFMYLKDWPTKVEISGEGVDDEVMLAQSIGTQEGLGILGFCYIPYHFVYDLSFPVLIQIYNDNELFQFPVAVIVDKNLPRVADFSVNFEGEGDNFDLCKFKNQNLELKIYDYSFNKVNANVSFECFNQKCRLGESKDGKFMGSAPSCVNGYLVLSADGFSEKREIFSTNSQNFGEVFLEREYELEVEDDKNRVGQNTIITFTREDGKTSTAVLPENNKIKLSEGDYEVKAYVYGNSSFKIPASSKTQCFEVPKAGLLGFFGSKKEECVDVNIPETKIDFALVGGGSSSSYILESDLEKGTIRINVPRFTQPRSIDELQNNFASLESSKLNLEFGK